jgi:Raf kinase inhibitor-like YbhB/YbcL family protein
LAFTLKSPAFQNGEPIPKRHARDGDNLSPFLEWDDPPPGTQSYVLVMEDVDAPQTVRHWAVYDIPQHRRHLAEGRSSKASAEDLPHAFNDFGNTHYDGPARPDDNRPHTYRFRLAALGIPSLGIPAEPDASTVWEAARNNLLAEAELTGIYPARSGQ